MYVLWLRISYFPYVYTLKWITAKHDPRRRTKAPDVSSTISSEKNKIPSSWETQLKVIHSLEVSHWFKGESANFLKIRYRIVIDSMWKMLAFLVVVPLEKNSWKLDIDAGSLEEFRRCHCKAIRRWDRWEGASGCSCARWMHRFFPVTHCATPRSDMPWYYANLCRGHTHTIKIMIYITWNLERLITTVLYGTVNKGVHKRLLLSHCWV